LQLLSKIDESGFTKRQGEQASLTWRDKL